MQKMINGVIESSIQFYSECKLFELGIKGTITKIKQRTGVCGCQPWDYAILYQYIAEKRPKLVLEFGTGLSTVVMAYAMKVSGINSKVISYDNDIRWSEKAQTHAPIELSNYIEFRVSPARLDRWKGIEGVCYLSDEYEKLDPDFVFCDGPPLEFPYPDGKRYPNIDLLKLLETRDRPLDALIDGRIETCDAVRQFIGDKIYYDKILKLGIIEQVTRNDLKIPIAA